MLKISATLIGTYQTDEYTNTTSGVTTAPKKRFQLMLEKPMKNGSIKKELLDISVNNEVYEKHKHSIGKIIEIDVGYFGQITFFGI